jgi:hypothetical protein
MSELQAIVWARTRSRSIPDDGRYHRIQFAGLPTNVGEFKLTRGDLIIPVTGFYTLHAELLWLGGTVGHSLVAQHQDFSEAHALCSSGIALLAKGTRVWIEAGHRTGRAQNAMANLRAALIAEGTKRDIALRNKKILNARTG